MAFAQRPSRMLSDLRNFFERTAAERPVLAPFLVFMAFTAIVVPISIPFYLDPSGDFGREIVAELHGVLVDLLLIGWLLFWLNKFSERRIRNNRYREEIEDYLGWRSNWATMRIAGNLRRLNRGGITSSFRLTEAHLENAKLGNVQMEKTDLWGAHLDGASLREALLDDSNLAGSSLERADLERASLARCDLRGANLNDSDLERATLTNADLRGASLLGADLQYANLRGSNLGRSKFIGANLRGANLEEVNLCGATLEGAHVRGASLKGARLIDVDLTGADLLGADFSGTRLPEDEEDLVAMFEKAKSLFGAEFEPHVARRLEEAMPSAFEMADRNGSDHEPARMSDVA